MARPLVADFRSPPQSAWVLSVGPTLIRRTELDDCIVAVLQSPTAVASVLDVIRLALRDAVWDRPEYADVQVALLTLRDELDGNHQL